MPSGNIPKGNGQAIIFSAPSGAGKTTMVKNLMENSELSLGFSVSATTRPIRGDEVDGESYYYLTPSQFDLKIEKGEFVEWEEVYSGTRYGTLCIEVEKMWGKGLTPVFDVDVIGGKTLKEVFADSALSIFIVPPSIEVLEKRLRGRGTESEKNIKRRLAKSLVELNEVKYFDIQIENDNLKSAILEAKKVVTEFLNK